MQPLLDIVIWNLVAVFLKRLDDELTIDQVLERGLPRFLISGSNSSRVTHIAQHHAGVLQASHAQVDA